MPENRPGSAENDASAPCKLGRIEYDQSRYCFEHGGFLNAGEPGWRCDRATPIPPAKGEAL